MFRIPKDVTIITLSIAGDVIVLSDKVVTAIRDFYMKPVYKIKVPYHCKLYEFEKLSVAADFFKTNELFKDDCKLHNTVYKNPLPNLEDLETLYLNSKFTKNMTLLKQIGWEFFVDKNRYLFENRDTSKKKTYYAQDLENKLNGLHTGFLRKYSKKEGRDDLKKIKYNIRNHLSGDLMKDQELYFYTSGAKCYSDVCSMDIIRENKDDTARWVDHRFIYKNCHQFGVFKLSELIKLHGPGVYIVHACRTIRGVKTISEIELTGLRQPSFDYDEMYDDI